MAFDPDAYLKKKQASGDFDPDAYLAKDQSAAKDERPWYEVSAKGLARGAIDAIPVVSAAAGGVVGGLAGAAGGPAAIATGIGGAGLGYAAGEELADGLRNRLLGDEAASTKPIEQVKRVAGNVRDGAMMEMGGQAVAGGVQLAGKGLKKIAEVSADQAERLMARALGVERGTIKSIGWDKIKAGARQMIDEGGVGWFDNTDKLAAKNTAIKKKGGKMMGEAYDAIDGAGASTFNPREVAEKVDDALAPTWRTAINKGETNQFDNTIESILERGPGDIPLKEAQLLKEELKSAANWKNKLQVTPKEQMARDAYAIVNQQIDEAVRVGAKAVDNAGLTETLAKGKKLYGNASTADKLLENKLAREEGNKILGLDNLLSGGVATTYGVGTGDWETAGGLFLGKKYLQKYGPQQGAKILDKVSKAIAASPKIAALEKTNPKAFTAAVAKIEQMIVGPGASTMKAADSAPEEKSNPSAKGPEKWAADGIAKLGASLDADVIAKAKADPRGKELLMQASDLKPGSKAFEQIVSQIKARYPKGKS